MIRENSNLTVQEKFSLKDSLAVAALISLTLWLLGPALIYYTNSLEFSFSFSEIAPWLCMATLATMVFLIALLWLFRTFYEKCIAGLTAFAAMLWLQGNVLVWNYGPLDGREIYWGKMWFYGMLDAALWVICIVLAIKKSKIIFRYARMVALVLIAMQCISLTGPMLNVPEAPFKHYEIDDSAKYDFSSKQNIIVLMLDTYQTDIFQEIISSDDYYKDIFRGFTYFRNALSAFPKTYTSVPSFLTANTYDNATPMSDFLAGAYTSSSSLPKILMEKNFRVELYPMASTEKTIYFDQAIASNIKKKTSNNIDGPELGFLVDISWFRHVPHFGKRFIYNNQKWLLKRLLTTRKKTIVNPVVSGRQAAPPANVKNIPRFSDEAMKQMDIQFIHQLLTQSRVKGDRPVFKYYHLNGLHRPINIDHELNIKKMPYKERSSIISQGKGLLEITRLMLETLKNRGIFDNALIVVMADHGCADYPYGVKVTEAGLENETGTADYAIIPSHIKAAGLPIMLIKAMHAGDEELKISDAPVSLTDLPHTVLAAMGIKKEMPGADMLSLEELAQRERKFYYYNWNGWGDGYLYHMREYVINGHSWLDSSWRLNRVVQPANAGKPYQYGTVIHFSRKGNSMRYQGVGWHRPEKKGFTWSREREAEIYLNITPSKKNLKLDMVLKPYLVPGKLEEQTVNVSVNGRKLKTFSITNPNLAPYSVSIPVELVTGSRLRIEFNIPTATAPVDLNIGTDVRTLGIALKTMVIE